MRYSTQWVENKSPDWKIVSVTGVDGTKLTDASVNRVNKKGEVFPNFDAIIPGYEFEAEPWKSEVGKQYLFAPKVQGTQNKSSGGAYKGSGGIAKAQEKKAEMIAEAQGNKELGIKISSTLRMAVDLAIAEGNNAEETLEQSILKWRKWLWSEWSKTDGDFSPF